jgi:Asp-tRNA(Asn)/Glu-tRNA(Gln) amidotransferase A subunit family amidase
VGLKPTYGNVSRSGIIAMASSLDQVGPIGKTVRDVEILYEAISAYDKNDSTSIPAEKRVITKSFKKVLGVPKSFLAGDGINSEVLKNFEESCEKLKKAGYEIVDVSLPLIKYSLAVYYIIQPAEVSSNLARYDGIRYGLSVESDKLYDVYTKTRGVGFGKEVRSGEAKNLKVDALNLSQYTSIEADALLTKIRQTRDPALRDRALTQLNALLKKDVPAIFLYSPLSIFGYRDRIGGIAVANLSLHSDRFQTMEQWYVHTRREFKDGKSWWSFVPWLFSGL